MTHLLMGHAMGSLASTLSPTAGAAVYWAALLGNSLPDLDVPLSLILRRGIKLHRTFTHTLPGTLLLSAVAAHLIGLYHPGASLGLPFAWSLMGCLAHLLVDCLNLFGARPFWPLHSRVVELGVLHILDPLLMLLLGLPSVITYFGWSSSSLVAMAFLSIWPYIGYRLRSARRLLRKLQRAGSLRARVVPWFSGWRYVMETEGQVEFGRWLRGERHPLETFPKAQDPRIEASLADPRVTQFLSQSEYPVALLQGDEVVWIDALRRLRSDFQPLRIPIQ